MGVASDTVNSVTLFLDKTEVYSDVPFNAANTYTYQGSTVSSAMSTFLGTLGTDAGIIEKTLFGSSNSYGVGGYNEDNIAGSNAINQKVWPLSVDEASHLILSTRIFPGLWWLRTPGGELTKAAKVNADGEIRLNGGDVDGVSAVRPALYLDINSPAFSSLIFDIHLPIGACAPQPNNLGINYIAETVTGLDTDTQGWSLADSYAGLTTPTQTTATPINISSNIGATASTLYYVKATTNTDLYFNSNSDSNGVARLNAVEGFSKLTIPARPVAPASPEGGVEKITGVTNSMEYSTDEVSWTAVGGLAITGLTSGTYYVRTIADQSAKKFKSFATEVVVKEGSAEPSAGKPGSGNSGPSAGDGGGSTEGTAQTGVDFAGLGLMVLLMLVCSVIVRSSKPVPSLRALARQSQGV